MKIKVLKSEESWLNGESVHSWLNWDNFFILIEINFYLNSKYLK